MFQGAKLAKKGAIPWFLDYFADKSTMCIYG